ncbi:hypothetical protein MNB_SUP05-7-705 [hydrothermal vent metagenome]|uniref:Uncharacterized protein n=1 Tax=hydrothermal vent metagenome TaxID=652676 RepID=A0A1W1DUD4_9ZZZZ
MDLSDIYVVRNCDRVLCWLQDSCIFGKDKGNQRRMCGL